MCMEINKKAETADAAQHQCPGVHHQGRGEQACLHDRGPFQRRASHRLVTAKHKS